MKLPHIFKPYSRIPLQVREKFKRNFIVNTAFLFSIMLAMVLTGCGTPVQPSPASSNLEAEATSVEETEEIAITVTQVEAGDLSIEQLKNTSYSGIYDKPITLSDGLFDEQPFLVEFIEDAVLMGDLDGDGVEDALVFLLERGGGTAAFTYVAAQLNQTGMPVDAGAALVEDRTQIRSAIIEDNRVILDIITRGPGDPDCCATHKARKVYALEEGRLVEVPVENQELVKISLDDLKGTSWTLLELNEGTPVLADSEITITFEDGKLGGSGGCNNYHGSFSLGGPNPFVISIGPIASTKKACADPVLNQENSYLKALQSASLWGYKHGDLILAYLNEQGEGLNRLLFRPNGRDENTVEIMNEPNLIDLETPDQNEDNEEATMSNELQSESKPEYVSSLETVYGPPSQSGFGSAVFFEQLKGTDDLEQEILKKYKYFVGETWERYGEEAWMSAWKQVYTRPDGATHDIVAELEGIKDFEASMSVPMFLTGVENADAALKALSIAYDNEAVADLLVYNLGDGGAMSGLLIAGRRSNGETTFVAFLMD